MGLTAYAQVNLVRNGSFEVREPNFLGDSICPSSGGNIGIAKHWNSAWGSVDYFNVCSNEDWPLWGVPHNFYGAQKPYDGDAYAALTTYTPVFSNAREYLWQPLESELKAGYVYEFSCWVSLCDSMNWASDGIGVLFTSYDNQAMIDSMLGAVPQISSPEGLIYPDKSVWTEITGQFVAAGGERYITIGAFEKDADISFVQVSDHYIFPYNWNSAVYYIDAISLYELSGVGIQDQSSIGNGQLSIHPNPAGEKVKMTVQGSKFKVAEVVVTDHHGRTVLLNSPPGKEGPGEVIELSVSDLPSGIYTVSVHLSDGTKLHERLVVQHQ